MTLLHVAKKLFFINPHGLLACAIVVGIIALALDMPWPPDQGVQAADGNMILFWDGGGAVPSGWTDISAGFSGNPYIRANSTYGTTGGSPTHSHTPTYVSETSASTLVGLDDTGGPPTMDSTGTHSHGGLASAVVNPANNTPPYRSLRVMEYTTGGVPATIPSGAIVPFAGLSYAGGDWDTYTAQNGYLLYANTSVGTGGSTTHTHNWYTGLTAEAGMANGSDFGGAVNYAMVNHGHGIGGTPGTTDADNNIPDYIDVVFYKANTDTVVEKGMLAGFTDSQGVSSDWDFTVSQSGGAYYQRFLMGDSVSPGNTYSDDDVSDHANATHTTGVPDATGKDGVSFFPNYSAAGSAHTHTVTVSFSSNDANVPAYTNMILAQFAPPYAPVTRNWRWFDAEDVANPNTTNGGETTTGDAIAAEDTQPTNTRIMYKQNAIKLRLVIGETEGVNGTDVKFWLQYDTTTSFLSPTTVAAQGSTAVGTLWRYYNGDNVADDDAISTTRLSGSPSAGRHNEDSTTGSGAGEGSTFDPLSLTDYEHEFTIQSYNAVANDEYFFRVMYCEDSKVGACIGDPVALGSGEAYPNIKTSAAYDLETYQVPANVNLGQYTKGGAGTLQYVFQAGEEVVFWDKRGTAAGYTLTVNSFSMACSSPADTIPGTDITWTSAAGSLDESFASDSTSMTGNNGQTLDSNRTAYNAASSADPTVRTGGFFFLPTFDLADLNSRAVCEFEGTLQITIA